MEDLKAEVDRLVRSRPADALPVAESLLEAAEGLPDLQPLALRGRGLARLFNGQYAGSIEDYGRALELYERAGQELEAARVRRSMVESLHMSGRTEEALEAAEKARATFARLGETRLLAQLEVNVGNLHVRLDRYPEARERYTAARTAFELVEDEAGLAIADYNLGVVEQNANRVDEARRAFERARGGLERAGMAVHVADCDYSLAYLESRRGCFSEAIEGLLAAKRAYAENGKPSGEPLCDLDLAEIYLRLDARRDALEHARRAAERFDELGLEYELARSLVLVGLARAKLGDRSGGRTDLARAAACFTALGNVAGAASLEIHQADLGGREALDDLSVQRLELARRTLEEQGLFTPADLAAVVLARLHLLRDEPERAASLLEERTGGGRERRISDLTVSSVALRVLAQAREAIGDREGSLACLQRAVDTIEDTYARIPGSDIRLAFFRDHHAAYTDLVSLLIEEGEPEATREALELLERSRSRSLRELAPARRSETPAVRRVRERLDWLLARRLDEEFGPPAGTHEMRRWRVSDTEILELEQKLLRLVRGGTQRAAGPTLDFDPEDLGNARRGDEALVFYLTGARGVHAFVERDEGLACVPLPIGEERLGVLRDRLRLHMDKLRLGNSFVARNRDALQDATDRLFAELGRCLLAPLAHLIDGRPLVVVPYGLLHDLPFHAFELGGAPLVAHHDVSYGLSASMLARCRGPRAGRGEALTGPFLIAADTSRGLPAAERELAALCELFGDTVEVLEAPQVFPRLRDEAPRGGLLHVASHGLFQARIPIFSALCLGRTFLFAHDLLEMDLDLELVTLSGCETGRGLRAGGDEVFGLSRALLGAGVRATLGSLWAVEDGDASEFMTRFYRSLAAGADARASVAQAQRALLDEGVPPCSWAPFALVGDPLVALPAPSPAPIPHLPLDCSSP